LVYDFKPIFNHHWNNLHCTAHQQILLSSYGMCISYYCCNQRIGIDMTDSLWRKRQEPEALKRITRDDTEHDRHYYLADEVDALLAQTEQEPVALLNALEVAREWIGAAPHGDNCFLHDDGEYNSCFCGKDSIENYIDGVLENTTPPQRKPLTDEWIRSRCGQTWVFETAKQWIRIAEAAHSIKE